jgi:5-methylcytosine-specific restriction endonuclease McrA
MIHVARDRVSPPPDWQARAAQELAAAAEVVSKRRQPAFKLYRLPQTKDLLHELFHGKCAFCESPIGVVSSPDIEHFRPKSRAIGLDGTVEEPGYWWLAAEWTNLFPACPHCNRPTQHQAAGGGTTAGKGMRFPLVQPRQGPPAEGDENGEAPLILNPSDPDPELAPERHLQLSTQPGQEGVMKAADDGHGGDDPLGALSIEVYALNRDLLVRRRRGLLQLIRTAITTIKDTTIALEDALPGSAAAAALERTIEAQGQLIKGWTAEDAEYLLLARQFTASVREADG